VNEEVNRNVGVLEMWRGKWDFKVLQDYNFVGASKKVNTIQLSLDVLNLEIY
jgi:hypothetical protein